MTVVELRTEGSQPCEVWIDIPGYKDRYQISSFGRVKSLPFWKENGKFSHMTKEKILKQWKRGNYLLVSLEFNGVRKIHTVHRLVYSSFNGEIKDKSLVHHKDHNKLNNSANNLEQMDSLKHNRLHHVGGTSWNKGLKYGETDAYKKSNTSRLDNYKEKCKNILAKKRKGLSVHNLANEYNCTVRAIYTILKKGREYE